MEHLNPTSGPATNVEYVLTRLSHGAEVYWRGGFSLNGWSRGAQQTKASISTRVNDAVTFDSIDAATATATSDSRLLFFRVAPKLYKKNFDGFRSRWWMEAP